MGTIHITNVTFDIINERVCAHIACVHHVLIQKAAINYHHSIIMAIIHFILRDQYWDHFYSSFTSYYKQTYQI